MAPVCREISSITLKLLQDDNVQHLIISNRSLNEKSLDLSDIFYALFHIPISSRT